MAEIKHIRPFRKEDIPIFACLIPRGAYIQVQISRETFSDTGAVSYGTIINKRFFRGGKVVQAKNNWLQPAELSVAIALLQQALGWVLNAIAEDTKYIIAHRAKEKEESLAQEINKPKTELL